MLDDVHSNPNVHLHWSTFSLWLGDELERQRKRIEGDLDPIETAKVRGRIQALKEILALPEKAAQGQVVGPDSNYHGG